MQNVVVLRDSSDERCSEQHTSVLFTVENYKMQYTTITKCKMLPFPNQTTSLTLHQVAQINSIPVESMNVQPFIKLFIEHTMLVL